MDREDQCQACRGSGIRAPAHPSCKIAGNRWPWIVVERCDTCERFADDLQAALTDYAVAGWFRCVDGGWHALADSRWLIDREDAERSA